MVIVNMPSYVGILAPNNIVPGAGQLRNLLANTWPTTEQAIALNLWFLRRQLFNNGNQRTVMAAANGLMVQVNTSIAFSQQAIIGLILKRLFFSQQTRIIRSNNADGGAE